MVSDDAKIKISIVVILIKKHIYLALPVRAAHAHGFANYDADVDARVVCGLVCVRRSGVCPY